MADIEIKRGYEVLPDNRVRFGIRVINNGDFAISDVEVILDYSRSLFELEGSRIEELGTIPPSIPRTAKFILKPLGCVHTEEIGATVRYRDHKWEKCTFDMRPKEIHCVCPFLKEKTITRTDFLQLFNGGFPAERGLNFENIQLEKVVEFITHTCKNRLYKVDEFPLENGKILYLAGDSVGEKVYYLLTAIVIEREGIVQVLFQAKSDKEFGINGFLNEIVENLRHLVQSLSAAKEIGIIKNEQVINIIDSVVQHTNFSGGISSPSVNIQDSVVQRTNLEPSEDENLKRETEEKLRREQEEAERKARGELERKKLEEASKAQASRQTVLNQVQQNAPLKKMGSSSGKGILVLSLIFGVLLIGGAFSFFVLNGGSDDNPQEIQPVPVTPSESSDAYTNSIGMEFVKIPAGEFMMGSPSDENGRYEDEGPVHKVTIKEAFYLGRFEVTQEQWREVMGSNPSNFKGDDLPVEQVSWNDVQEFIEKLNEMEGTKKYRLPSEAEWEYTCRAGTTTRYYFGDGESKLGDYAWYTENSGSKTHPVGQKKPNTWGLYDMHANIWEWVQDEWHSDYNGAPSDGSAWESGSSSDRVSRGGSWFSFAWDCRSAYRTYFNPGYRGGNLGFRVLRKL